MSVKDFMANCSNLQSLELKHLNPQQLFKNDSIDKHVRTEILRWSQTGLQEVPKDLFIQFPSLEFLSLERNQLGKIEKCSFHQLRILTSLDLSHSSIYWIEPGAFHGLNGLVILHLDGNPLHTLDASLMNRPKLFHLLSLKDLSLDCDCDLFWLGPLAHKHRIIDDGLRCTNYDPSEHNPLTYFPEWTNCTTNSTSEKKEIGESFVQDAFASIYRAARFWKNLRYQYQLLKV